MLVFILFSLISMNKMLNQNRFRMYPKAEPVPEDRLRRYQLE